MKVEIKEDKIIVKRNKKGGTKLRVVKRNSGYYINCHVNCDLYSHSNSLCSNIFHLCNYLREKDLVYGDFWFKLG